jgi:hypothetical protein
MRAMERKPVFKMILTGAIMLGITIALFLYTAGYRVKRARESSLEVEHTGMISAKSIPEGANVYVNGELKTATDDTVGGLLPGIYNLKIYKKGFVEWKKDIEVYPELVTDITAVLISQSPRLEPLTNTGARFPIVSPSLSRLAYFSKDGTNPGVWVIPLSYGGLSLFRSESSVALEDTPRNIYSNGKSIEWSPDEKQLLVEDSIGAFYIVDLDSNTAEATASPDLIRTDWAAELTKKREDFMQKLDIPENIKALAISPKSSWSPDEKKFLYTTQTEGQLEYKVYNMEKPLPIGEKVENVVFVTNVKDPQPQVTWYSDSYHLLLTEGNILEDKRGTVSIIRIDGTNKTEVYNGTIYSDTVYSATGGDKLIMLTSFKSSGQTDLYTIGIR